jgi:maltose/moltooligosaccharide transporter
MTTSSPTAGAILRLPTAAVYTVGTLHYDRKGLCKLFGWLLWGDFAFTFFEAIFSRFIPIYLKDLQASNVLIGIMTGSIAGLVNVLFLPNISQWSDRFRSRLGRRIPFLLVITPVTVMSLILIGFTPELGRWMHQGILDWIVPGLSEQTLGLSLLCVFVILYHFFNMVLVNSYNWLLRDVVPQPLMARFLSWFRVVGTIASFVFLWYVFPTIVGHRQAVCTGVGIFYLASFLLMCFNVKEGDYPEPVASRGKEGLFKSFLQYFADCLSVPLYRNFFITWVCVLIANNSASPFLTLYARHGLGLSMEELGRVFAWSALTAAFTYFLMGWLCEKWNPLRVAIASLIFCAALTLLAFWWVDNKKTWLIYSIAATLPMGGWFLASLAISMQIFPGEDFGKFASGLNVFGCGGLILGNYLSGQFMDLFGSDYRIIFMWSFLFYAASVIPMFCVYRGWKQHGGPSNYVPPKSPQRR